jgi:hypothetical protein
MKSRRKRRALWALALLAGLLLALLIEERLRGTLGLREWEREMRARGEPVTVDEVMAAIPTNLAARAVSSLAAQPLLSVGGAPQDAPRGMSMVAAGKARVAWAQESWLDDQRHTFTWQKLRPLFDYLHEPLASARERLTNQPFVVQLDYRAGFDGLLPHLTSAKSLAQALAAHSLLMVHERDFDTAQADLLALAALVELQEEERFVICQLVRIACAQIAFATLWDAIQSPGWNDAQLASLQASWERITLVRGMTAALQMERAVMLESSLRQPATLKRLRQALTFMPPVQGLGSDEETSGGLRKLWGGMLKPVFDKGDEIRQTAFLVVWRFAWAAQDRLSAQLRMHTLVEAGRSAVRAQLEQAQAGPDSPAMSPRGSWRRRRPDRFLPAEQPLYDRLRYRFAMASVTSVERSLTKAVVADTFREMAITAIALKRYQLRTGRLPADLQAIVPEFLGKAPIDWLASRPLCYRLAADEAFVLYSVGEDGVDDGGDPRPTEGPTNSVSVLRGRDLVWPMPATAAEINAATLRR